MSIVVTATPISLLSSLGPLVLNIVAPMVASDVAKKTANNYANSSFIDNVLEKELQTNIMDKDTLLKTLVEHGAEITADENNIVECEIENLSMQFYKTGNLQPYKLTVKYINEKKLQCLMKELSEEYKTNAQEVSYNQIMENLKTKNYSVEQEEILEDSTIVLTVNLE